LSLSCLLIGSSSTYGLGGFLRFVKGREVDQLGDPQEWQFFQPFSGGPVFVATQALGWTLFTFTTVGVVLLVQQVLAGVAFCIRCSAYTLGVLMIATQMVSTSCADGEYLLCRW
jgi:diacylglycerol O-acyltransferase 2, plant